MCGVTIGKSTCPRGREPECRERVRCGRAGGGHAGDGARTGRGRHRRAGVLHLDRADAQPVGDRVPRRTDREHRGRDHDDARGDGEQRAHAPVAWLRGLRRGRGDAPAHDLRELVPGRVVEVFGEVEERCFQIDHNVTSSPSATRNRSRARDRRDFAVPRGHDERGRGLGLAESGEVAQRDDLPVTVRQPRDFVEHTLAARVRGRDVVGSRAVGLPLAAHLEVEAVAARAGAAAVAGLVRDDREQPRAEHGVGAEAAEVPVRLDERVLDGIFCIASGDSVRDAERRFPVAADQSRERVEIALPGGDHQLRVGASIHVVTCIHRSAEGGSRRGVGRGVSRSHDTARVGS